MRDFNEWLGKSARPPMPVMPTSSCPSTAMPPKPKKPTARKPGPVPAITVAACWRAASRTRLSMPLIGVKIATPGVNGLYVLTNTDMPAVLVELAFITNPNDEDILANAQDALARAVARDVTDYEQLILGGKCP